MDPSTSAVVEITEGFRIEQPSLTVPWGITETDLIRLFPKGHLNHVTTGYYVADCVSLGGRRHMLGFHFEPRSGGRLHELELYREDAPLSESYPDWQRRLEAEFGPPHSTSEADEGRKRHTWKLGTVEVEHTVVERFGPGEYVRIAGRGLPGVISN
jgi:hypothetical protein